MTSNQEIQLNSYISKAGFSNFKVIISDGSNQNNFFGKVFKVIVEGTKNDKQTTEKLFVKTHSVNEERNRRVKIEDKFNREAFLYNKIIPEFESLQSEIPDVYKIYFPKCLYADDNCLVMEDLSSKSYKEIDEKIMLNAEHIHIMMKELAKFHSLSFALKQYKPEKYAEFKKFLKSPNIPDAQRRTFLVKKVWDWTLDALDNEDIKCKLIRKKEELLNEDMIDSDSIVICHGDYNLRNVLFKYDKEEEPKALAMIDFQLSYASSPVADIFFAIFSSTTSELRKVEYENFKDIYHKNLTENLLQLKCDPNRVYPRHEFEADFHKYFRREFATILVIIRLMCIAFKGENEELKQKPTSTILDYNSEIAEGVFKKRINEVMNDFARLGYI